MKQDLSFHSDQAGGPLQIITDFLYPIIKDDFSPNELKLQKHK